MESRVESELVRKCRTGESRFFEPLVRAYEAEAIRILNEVGMPALSDMDEAVQRVVQLAKEGA